MPYVTDLLFVYAAVTEHGSEWWLRCSGWLYRRGRNAGILWLKGWLCRWESRPMDIGVGKLERSPKKRMEFTYYYHCYCYSFSPLCSVFTIMYMWQTTFLGYIVLQLFCSCSLWHILFLFITFLQDIYNYISETNHISRVHSVAAILYFQFMHIYYYYHHHYHHLLYT